MFCSKEFTATKHSGLRSMAGVKWIVLHDEEALTARSAAAWFANTKSAGSAHRCVDDKECYRTLADNYIPWAAPNSNSVGLHIEMAGFASWSRRQWLKRLKTLNRAAKIAAHWSKEYGIPCKRIHSAGMAAGKHGICGHVDVSNYTKLMGLSGDSSHTDPGANFPWKRFMFLAKMHRARLGR